MKICKKCLVSKPEEDFNKDKTTSSGLRGKCRKCTNKRAKEWNRENKNRLSEKKAKYQKEYRQKNKILISKQRKIYCCKNSKAISKQSANYYKLNKEEIKKQHQSKEGKEAQNRSRMNYRAQKLSTKDGTITKASLQALRASQDNKCAYCNNPLDFTAPREAHIDHVRPLSKGGIHSISNVVYSCRLCNQTKSDKLIS